MNIIQQTLLMKTIKDELTSGKNVTIIGWENTSAYEKSRQYEKTGRIIFINNDEKILETVGSLAISTPLVSPFDHKKLLKNNPSMFPHIVNIAVLERVFQILEKYIVSK